MQVLMEQKIGKIHADRRNACAARKGSDRLMGQHRGPCHSLESRVGERKAVSWEVEFRGS